MNRLKVKAKKRPAKPKLRKYNNARRESKSADTQKLIIQVYIQLLAAHKGESVQIEEIAKKAKVSERTVFRFFKDKRALHKATDDYIQQFIEASATKIDQTSVPTFAKTAFSLFDKHETLMLAYMFSYFGSETRTIFRKRFNKLLIDRILRSKSIDLNKQNKLRLAVIVSMINVKIWYDIRTDFGYSGDEIGEAMEWAVNTLVSDL